MSIVTPVLTSLVKSRSRGALKKYSKKLHDQREGASRGASISIDIINQRRGIMSQLRGSSCGASHSSEVDGCLPPCHHPEPDQTMKNTPKNFRRELIPEGRVVSTDSKDFAGMKGTESVTVTLTKEEKRNTQLLGQCSERSRDKSGRLEKDGRRYTVIDTKSHCKSSFSGQEIREREA